MDKQALKNHITVLKRTRDACSSQLDIGTLTELDGVIEGFERLSKNRYSAEEIARLTLRALRIIAVVVSISTNIHDFLK
jgi:hypothetical protein